MSETTTPVVSARSMDALLRRWLCPVLCAAVQGCASSEPELLQTIRLQTPGCAVASCELSNERGRWQLASTPGSVTVAVSRQPLQVTCRGEAAAAGSRSASSSRPATTGAGAVTGGVVGGAAVGAALGAAALAFIPPLGVIAVLTGVGAGAVAGDVAESHGRPLRYPELINVPLSCATSGTSDAGPMPAPPLGPRLGLTIRGLTLAEAQAAGLNGRTAVIVISVIDDGRAAAAGLRQGDVILAMNGQDLFDAADLEERLLALPQERPLTLRLWRDRRRLDLVLTRSMKDAP